MRNRRKPDSAGFRYNDDFYNNSLFKMLCLFGLFVFMNQDSWVNSVEDTGWTVSVLFTIHVAFHWNSGTHSNFHSVGALGSFTRSKVTIMCRWLFICVW